MNPLLAMYVTERLVHLSGVDLAIISFYFVLVLVIGFYLKRFANTGEDFFLAGRENRGPQCGGTRVHCQDGILYDYDQHGSKRDR